MQLTLKGLFDELSENMSLLLVKCSNNIQIFSLYFKSLCTGQDLWSILRFIQPVITSLMFKNMVTESKESVHMWIYNLLCVHLPNESVQTFVFHSFDLSAVACHSRERLTYPTALFLKFLHISPPIVFEISMCE